MSASGSDGSVGRARDFVLRISGRETLRPVTGNALMAPRDLAAYIFLALAWGMSFLLLLHVV
ncbi:hypothetical protein NSY55_27130, partial [Pseudomonas aeruginosa]|nr:hypothetical protein [Pseudomonas aeruginosa]